MTPFLALRKNLDNSSVLVKQYAGENTTTLQKELGQHIENNVLQIMLYGAYNAGKSTLTNALLGREAARVNDIPTTDRIDLYDWEGFHLLDTPGVNAPIEHEKTTEEQLKRSNVMLFVIREGDQDARDVYERLFNMLKRGKKIFIVLNHQLSSLSDKALATHKINEILIKLASDYGITQDDIAQITIYPVNVQTAYRGRIKNSDKLLEHSGYIHFLQGFRQWVKAQDNEKQHLERLKKQIEERWYDPAIQLLETRMGADSNSEVQHLKDNRLILESEQRSLKMNICNFINQQVNLLKSDVSSVLQQSKSQAELDSNLQRVFMGFPSLVEAWLNDELGKVSKKLSLSISHKYNDPQNKPNNLFIDKAIELGRTAFTSESKIKQALLLGRQFKIPGLKGRWETTLGQWAGKAAIAVQAVTFIYDIYSANARQEKENQQRRQHAVELSQAVDQICTMAINDMTTVAHEFITTVLQQKISEVQQQIDARLQANAGLKKDHAQLIQFKQQMSAIVW